MKNLFFIAVLAFMMMSCQKEELLVSEPISSEKKIYDYFKIKKIEKIQNFSLSTIKGIEKEKRAKEGDVYEEVEAIYYEDGNITYVLNDGTEENLIVHTSANNELLIMKKLIVDNSDFIDEKNYTFSISGDDGELTTFNVIDGIIIVDDSNYSNGKRYPNETFRQCMGRAYGIMTSDMIGTVSFGLFTGPILATMAVYCA